MKGTVVLLHRVHDANLAWTSTHVLKVLLAPTAVLAHSVVAQLLWVIYDILVHFLSNTNKIYTESLK